MPELAVRQHFNVAGFEFKTLDELEKFSIKMSKTGLIPNKYQGKPDDIFAAALYGQTLGLSFFQSLKGIAVINGVPCIWGDAALALILSHRDCEDIQESYDNATQTAFCTIKRKGRSSVQRSFSMQEAKTANLIGKAGPWQAYPKRMLQMRARGFALRDSFADALQGLVLTEEAMDIKEIDITPPDAKTKTGVKKLKDSFASNPFVNPDVKPEVYEHSQPDVEVVIPEEVEEKESTPDKIDIMELLHLIDQAIALEACKPDYVEKTEAKLGLQSIVQLSEEHKKIIYNDITKKINNKRGEDNGKVEDTQK